MIKILVVDDHTLVRAGLLKLLENETDMEVVAQAGSGHDGVRLCREKPPDVVLLDYSLPGWTGRRGGRSGDPEHGGHLESGDLVDTVYGPRHGLRFFIRISAHHSAHHLTPSSTPAVCWSPVTTSVSVSLSF